MEYIALLLWYVVVLFARCLLDALFNPLNSFLAGLSPAAWIYYFWSVFQQKERKPTPGVLLNSVGVSTSTNPTVKKNNNNAIINFYNTNAVWEKWSFSYSPTMYIAKVLSHFHDHVWTQSQIVLHLRWAEIEIAMLHPESFWFLPQKKKNIHRCQTEIRAWMKATGR